MNSFRDAINSGRGLHPKDPVVREKDSRGAVEENLESVEIPRVEERSANHRDDDRHRLTGETATARHKGDSHEVEIVNLSGGGAMIRAGFKPRLWDMVELALGDGPAFEGAVRWIRGDRIGLEFAHETRIECSPEERDALLLEVIRRSFPTVKALPERPLDAKAETSAEQDAGNRAEARHPLIWNGEIHYAHDSNRVRLRNVSSGGALVEIGAVTYPQGAEIMLDLGDAGEFFATVSWVVGDQLGLKFKKPFDVACLAKARPDLMPHRWNRPGFLDFAPDDCSPWDDQWGRKSLSDIRTDLEGFLKR